MRAGEKNLIEERGRLDRGGGVTIYSSVERLERHASLAKGGSLVRGRTFGEELARKSLEHSAGLIDRTRFGNGEGARYYRTSPGTDFDKSVGFQFAEHLANERAAHARHLAEFSLDQALARQEAGLFNCGA